MAKRRKQTDTRGRLRRVLVAVVFAFLAWSIGSVALLRFVDPPTTAFILEDRLHAWFASEPGYRYQHRWVDWRGISPSMKLAVMASEDQRFPDHFGFDLVQIEHAIEARERGGSLRGASTITQQTAKNLFLWPGQNWFRKGLEAYFTLLIETLWPKTRTLEMYLNVAEFGRGVWGIGAASAHYFRTTPARLNRSQSALLAAVLPNPLLLRVN